MKLFKTIKELLGRCYCNQRILFAVALVSFVIPNIILLFTEGYPILTGICNIVFPLGVFWCLMTLSRKPGKMVLILSFFFFLNAFQIVLLYLFGESVIAVDMFLNLATTNSGEAAEVLGNIMPSVLAVIVIYLPILLFSVVSLCHKGVEKAFMSRQRKVSLTVLAVGIGMLIGCYITDEDFNIKDEIYPANVVYNMCVAVRREARMERYFETSKEYKYASKDEHQKGQHEIYVMVIGETARAENFGIYGYKKRNTTPKLTNEKGLVVFRDVLSQSNTTHKSVPMLMSGLSAENFDSIYSQKGIITAYKEAGYRTAFFSNQRPNNSFIDFFGEEAHKSVFVKERLEEDANVSDDVLLKYLKRELTENKRGKLFIVLHTYGSHFNYYERYPTNRAYYKPDMIESVNSKHKEAFVNAYDNTIRYTDDFLHRLIGMVNNENAVSAVVYASDHGEDIFDDYRKLFLHASPIPSAHQLRVPLLIWTSEQYRAEYPEKCAAMESNKEKPVSSSLVTFHTILDLSGVKTKNYCKGYSLSSSEYTSPKRYYLNDHNEAMPLDEIGLKKIDEAYFKENNIVYP